MPTKNIINHLEKNLGQMNYGWKSDSSAFDITIAQFCNQPIEGMNTYTTLGLSDHLLSMPNGRKVRQEFVFSTFDYIDKNEIVSFMMSFSEFILTKHEGLLRGEIIGPSEPIFSNSTMNAIYSSVPVIFDDSFATFDNSNSTTVLVWLIPIFETEANYIQNNGWEAFEDLLEQEDPDLWDLNRNPITLSPTDG